MILEHEEEWRWITQNPMYAISSLGRVYNTKRDGFVGTHLNNCGYERVTLMVEGLPKKFFIHRLVAVAFLHHRRGTTQVNHIDGDKRNNDVENLEWVTGSENTKHAYDNELLIHYTRAIRIIETDEVFESITECAEAIGGSRTGIGNCLSGRSRSHRGLTFEYAD